MLWIIHQHRIETPHFSIAPLVDCYLLAFLLIYSRILLSVHHPLIFAPESFPLHSLHFLPSSFVTQQTHLKKRGCLILVLVRPSMMGEPPESCVRSESRCGLVIKLRKFLNNSVSGTTTKASVSWALIAPSSTKRNRLVIKQHRLTRQLPSSIRLVSIKTMRFQRHLAFGVEELACCKVAVNVSMKMSPTFFFKRPAQTPTFLLKTDTTCELNTCSA